MKGILHCRSHGMEMATFEVFSDIVSTMDKLYEFIKNPGNNFLSADILIGGIATYGPWLKYNWYWADSGVKIPEYFPWHSFEPSNKIDFCLAMNKDVGFKLKVIQCDGKFSIQFFVRKSKNINFLI